MATLIDAPLRMALPRQMPWSSLRSSVTFVNPCASMRERAWPSVKLFAPASSEPVLSGLPFGFTVTGGCDEPALSDGAVVEEFDVFG